MRYHKGKPIARRIFGIWDKPEKLMLETLTKCLINNTLHTEVGAINTTEPECNYKPLLNTVECQERRNIPLVTNSH